MVGNYPERHSHDFVWLDEGVCNGLLETQSRSLLVLQNTDVEGEGTRLLLNLGEDGTGSLHLELVGDGRVFLVDGGTRLLHTSLRSIGSDQCQLAFNSIILTVLNVPCHHLPMKRGRPYRKLHLQRK